MKKMIGAAGVAAATIVLSAGAVAAMPPNHFEEHFEDEFDIACDGFVLHASFTVDIHGTEHFDSSGELIRTETHIRFNGVITGPDGLVLRDPGYTHETFSAEDEIFRITGLVFNIVVPGRGSVVQDTGFIEFFPDGTIVIHGPHEVFEAGGDPAPLVCPLFE
jgi:hypothetical protein